jgi:hypothetical protein
VDLLFKLCKQMNLSCMIISILAGYNLQTVVILSRRFDYVNNLINRTPSVPLSPYNLRPTVLLVPLHCDMTLTGKPLPLLGHTVWPKKNVYSLYSLISLE